MVGAPAVILDLEVTLRKGVVPQYMQPQVRIWAQDMMEPRLPISAFLLYREEEYFYYLIDATIMSFPSHWVNSILTDGAWLLLATILQLQRRQTWNKADIKGSREETRPFHPSWSCWAKRTLSWNFSVTWTNKFILLFMLLWVGGFPTCKSILVDIYIPILLRR